ncbi:hypothetical protein MANES_11G121522v8 [Manihot esculenta]|uniref:Uncharacterized protein n=1 Tax=Manihot esculenta TaxID=3983 RepID=A0ACB7GWJ4_MANES|nr:hypothetical protein MANES_11G121522v8 [Manihot esculenta]
MLKIVRVASKSLSMVLTVSSRSISPHPPLVCHIPFKTRQIFSESLGLGYKFYLAAFFFVPILYESCFCCTSIGCDAAFVLKFAIAFVLIHQSRKGLLQKLCRIVSPYLHSAIPIHRNVQINILKAILFSFAKSVFFQNI